MPGDFQRARTHHPACLHALGRRAHGHFSLPLKFNSGCPSGTLHQGLKRFLGPRILSFPLGFYCKPSKTPKTWSLGTQRSKMVGRVFRRGGEGTMQPMFPRIFLLVSAQAHLPAFPRIFSHYFRCFKTVDPDINRMCLSPWQSVRPAFSRTYCKLVFSRHSPALFLPQKVSIFFFHKHFYDSSRKLGEKRGARVVLNL